MDDETPRQRMNLPRKPKALEDLDNVDPDTNPAISGSYCEDRPDGSCIWVLCVPGFGAFVIRAGYDETIGRLKQDGVSIFNERQIEAGEL